MADARTAAGLRDTLNGRVLDRTIRHLVHLERTKAGLSRRTLKFLDEELLPDLLGRIETRLSNIRAGSAVTPYTNTRLAQLFKSVDSITADAMRTARSELTSELESLARVEADWLPHMVVQEAPVAINMASLSTRQLQVIVRARPFQGRILRDHWSKVERDIREGVQRQIQLGVAQGESPRAIARRIRGTPRQPGIWPAKRHEVEATVRTAVSHVQAQTRELTYAENPRLVRRVLYVATLDSGTTVTCASLDGQTFPVDEGPRPPMHYGCRSSTAPVIPSWRELGIDLDEAPPGTRASMNGQVPETVTYESWLRSQPASVQRDVLGPTRAAAFRPGTPIDQFVAGDYSPISVSQLRSLEIV